MGVPDEVALFEPVLELEPLLLGVPEGVNVAVVERVAVGVREGDAPVVRLAVALSVVDSVLEGVMEGVTGAEGVGRM